LDLASLARRRDDTLASLEALAASPQAASELTDYADRLVGESEADLFEGLDLVMALLRDAARAASGCSVILHADIAPRIERLGVALGAGRATELVALVDQLRGDLRLNINKTLLAETILAAVAGGPAATFV
jgi:hypothetical protein